jgi:hypothetical protein
MSPSACAVPHLAIPLRMDDPGVAPLLVRLRKIYPASKVSFAVVDHGRVPVEGLRLDRVPTRVQVVRITPAQAAAVEAFYRKLLLPVDVELLALQCLEGRTVFAAVIRGRVTGACVVDRTSQALEWDVALGHLRVDPELAPPDYEAVWSALARAAVCEVARERDHVVSALHPADRPLAVRAGLLAAHPEQYVVVAATAREDVQLRVAGHILAHHRTRLAAA